MSGVDGLGAARRHPEARRGRHAAVLAGTAALGAVALGLAAGGTASAQTPNAFYQRGAPTFVVGTLGDDASDHAGRVQIDLVRGALFPGALVVRDVDVDLAAGAGASASGGRVGWPARPVLYGNPAVNALVAALADDLPVRFEPNRLVLGTRTFEGPDVRLIACIPAGARHPEVLLYAGVGAPGVAEINGLPHGPDAFVVGDRFGRLVAGTWEQGADGKLAPVLGAFARRERWHVCAPAAGTDHPPALTIWRLDLVKADEARDAAEDAAIRRGVARAVGRLGRGGEIAVYVHPDPRSKQLLTGNGGAGHADVLSHTLHVIRADPAPGGGLEGLVAHEATHVLGHQVLGPAASALLGEGLAVWVSGTYQGRTLAEHRPSLPADLPPVVDLLGRPFRALPEPIGYPAAGLLVGALVDEIGLERVARHLLPANPESWPRACAAAGTTPAAVEALFRRALAGR